jgi:hypothetical protein
MTTNVVNYLDDQVNGRRVDINFTVPSFLSSDTTNSYATRCVLQALLWSARKIN